MLIDPLAAPVDFPDVISMDPDDCAPALPVESAIFPVPAVLSAATVARDKSALEPV
jgi:hypothetical protein